MEEKRCSGCGAILQTIDDSGEGYIPPTLFAKEGSICQRCYRLQHYGQLSKTPTINSEYIELLKEASANNNLLVYVIDVFNFFGSIIEKLHEYAPNCPLFIVVNKYDLLPHSIKEEKIRNWVEYQLSKYGFKYCHLALVSSNANKNIDGLLTKIMNYANKKDIYVIGNANVGKSSLINALLRNYDNDTSHYITSSVFPGTTINTIKIPLVDGNNLYDTPGFANDTCIYRYLDGKNLKRVLNSKEIKPISYQLNHGQSLFIGSIAYLDFLEGDATTFIIYGSNALHLHRSKSEDSALRFAKMQKDPVYVPKANCDISKANMDCYEFNLHDDGRKSIIISGLVWIDVLKGYQKIKVYVPKGIRVSIEEPMIGGKYYAHK